MTESEHKDQPKFIRILCRMEAANSQEMINKVSKCIEYDNIEIKKEKRTKKLVNPQFLIDKNE
jgi:hypothetical protein